LLKAEEWVGRRVYTWDGGTYDFEGRKTSMKIRCDRVELGECLIDVLGIVPAGQTPKPILTDFHLKTDGEALILEATDLDVGARIRLERVEVEEGGEAAVPAARFTSLIREIPDKQVQLESLPGGCGVSVRTDNYSFKVLGEDPSEFPEGAPFPADAAFSVVRERFTESLRRVAVATSRDLARFQLTGVYFELDEDKLTLTATDGKRLTNDHVRVDNPKKKKSSAIVPNRAVDVLLKVLSSGDSSVSIALVDPDIHVSFARGDLMAKVIQGSYPDYQIALGQKVNARASIKRDELISATRTAALMTDKQTSTVLFQFDGSSLALSTTASNIGESRIQVPIALEGDPLTMRFNPAYFLDAVRCTTDEEVRIEFTDNEKPVVIRGGQHYRHLVMPLVQP
jgi:DNA polymerase-3 subunit beta